MTVTAPLPLNLPPAVWHRLQLRAANAGLLDAAGRPDVGALRTRAISALLAEGERPMDAIHALLTDGHDRDLASFIRASIAASVARNPPRWPSHLADHLDLPAGMLFRLHARAERERHPTNGVPDLALMGSQALALALNGGPATDADVARLIDTHLELPMRALFAALERARAAARPN